MNQYIENLNKYLAEQELGLEDINAESLIDVLFYFFCLENTVELPAVSKSFDKMETILEKLSLDDNNSLFLLTCEISEQYRREAFRTGLLVGFRLYRELCVE